jgi:hypothetical protein
MTELQDLQRFIEVTSRLIKAALVGVHLTTFRAPADNVKANSGKNPAELSRKSRGAEHDSNREAAGFSG